MNITFNKKRMIWSSTFCLVLLLIVSFNYKLYVTNHNLNIPLFLLSLFIPIFSTFIYSINFEGGDKTNRIMTIITFTFSIILSYVIIELLDKNNIFNIPFKRALLNLIVIIFLYLLVYIITNRIRITIIATNTILFILGLVNYTIVCFRGTPFVPWDVLSFRTAVSVAGAYTFIPSYYLLLAVLYFILAIVIALKANYKFKVTKTNVALRFAFLSIIILFTGFFYKTDLVNFFDLDTNLWQPLKEYSHNGFLASFAKQSKSLFSEKPENYSIQTVNNIINTYLYSEPEEDVLDPALDPEVIEEIDTPHIIVIMNESFSDLAVNGNFNTSADYMPYYRSLTTNTIKGLTYVSVLGGQTPNSEWEFLTNNSMAFMPYRTVPYQQYIHSKSYSLADTLKAQGYSVSAVHPWYGSGYRRNAVYPLLGFDSFDSIETLKDLEYSRIYPTDLSTYQYITKMFEERDTDKQFFNFTVTMQNHSGYDMPDYDSTISLTDFENCAKVEQYLSVIKESDDALKYLIDYFSNVEEHTIILFFGDHQPPYLEEEFWEALLSDNENSKTRYLTPFMLWANYDIEEQEIEYTSLNYLSLLLLDTAELQTTPYMEFLRILQEQIPVITGNGYMDKDGNFYRLDEESPYSELIHDYQILQYNNVFDSKNRVKDIFTVKQ